MATLPRATVSLRGLPEGSSREGTGRKLAGSLSAQVVNWLEASNLELCGSRAKSSGKVTRELEDRGPWHCCDPCFHVGAVLKGSRVPSKETPLNDQR